MVFEALYFGHFLSFYTMQLEPPKHVRRYAWKMRPLRVIAGRRGTGRGGLRIGP